MHVDEAFRGVEAGRTVDVVLAGLFEGPSGYEGASKRYLVFGSRDTFDGKTLAQLRDCRRNMVEISRAGALLEQLRRKQRGERVATLYGRLKQWRSGDPPVYTTWDGGTTLPWEGIRVTARSGGRTVTTTTRAGGTFMFERLRPGKYVITADLPVALENAATRTPGAAIEAEIARGDCVENDVTAFPTTRIAGRVIGQDGRTPPDTVVFLYRAGSDVGAIGTEVTFTTVPESGRFEFGALVPGDYIVAFGSSRESLISPDHPFQRTFHPAASTAKEAAIVHVRDGQQVDGADIHLPSPRGVRTVAVVFDWNGRNPADHSAPYVKTDARWSPQPTSPQTFSLRLVERVSYDVTVVATCRSSGRSITTDTVSVNASDGPDAIALRFPPGSCQ